MGGKQEYLAAHGDVCDAGMRERREISDRLTRSKIGDENLKRKKFLDKGWMPLYTLQSVVRSQI